MNIFLALPFWRSKMENDKVDFVMDMYLIYFLAIPRENEGKFTLYFCLQINAKIPLVFIIFVFKLMSKYHLYSLKYQKYHLVHLLKGN